MDGETSACGPRRLWRSPAVVLGVLAVAGAGFGLSFLAADAPITPPGVGAGEVSSPSTASASVGPVMQAEAPAGESVPPGFDPFRVSFINADETPPAVRSKRSVGR